MLVTSSKHSTRTERFILLECSWSSRNKRETTKKQVGFVHEKFQPWAMSQLSEDLPTCSPLTVALFRIPAKACDFPASVPELRCWNRGKPSQTDELKRDFARQAAVGELSARSACPWLNFHKSINQKVKNYNDYKKKWNHFCKLGLVMGLCSATITCQASCVTLKLLPNFEKMLAANMPRVHYGIKGLNPGWSKWKTPSTFNGQICMTKSGHLWHNQK